MKLFGSTSFDHGQFSLSLDGAPILTLNGTAPFFRPKQLLVRIITYLLDVENAELRCAVPI
jgi:hypothetical protein